MKLYDDSHKKKLSVFVDETTSNNHLCFGVFLIYEHKIDTLCKQLKEIKNKNNCNSDLTYKKLSGHITSGKIQTSMNWIKNLIKMNNGDFFFEFHKIDCSSPYFQNDKFTEEHHKYNRFLLMSLKSTLHKKIKNKDVVAKITLHRRTEPKETENDPHNKKEYLLKYMNQFKVNFESLIIVESSAELQNAAISEDECTLLQLTDLLLGSSYNAIHGMSEKDGKYHISTILSHIIKKCSTFNDSDSAYRNFNFSCFPGKEGNFDKITDVKIPPFNLDVPRANKSLSEFF
ncbi:MAG: hypothetical protein AABX33_00285 [Nanoarchaeota archaeon]